MGHFTEQMERVVQAITNSKAERARFMEDFKEKAAECAGIRKNFVKDVRNWVKDFKNCVKNFRENLRSDIEDARNVWQTFCQGSQRSFAGKTQQKGR